MSGKRDLTRQETIEILTCAVQDSSPEAIKREFKECDFTTWAKEPCDHSHSDRDAHSCLICGEDLEGSDCGNEDRGRDR